MPSGLGLNPLVRFTQYYTDQEPECKAIQITPTKNLSGGFVGNTNLGVLAIGGKKRRPLASILAFTFYSS
jgi:hypothetical protein